MKTLGKRICLLALGILGMSSAAFAASTTLVISQIYSGQNIGAPSGPRAHNDFIEIFNRGAAAVNLSTWTLQVAPPGAGSIWIAIPLSGSIAPGQYYLVAGMLRTGFASLPQNDVTSGVELLAAGGRVALVNGTTLLADDCPYASAADFLSYGSSICGPQGVALDSINALVRRGGGCIDVDGEDFSLQAPYPRTSSSPRNVCSTDAISRSFSSPANGGVSLQTSGASTTLGVGHIRMQPSPSSTAPSGLAIFSLRQGQILLSEASVPAVPLIRSGQVYVEASGAINTGIAISNPNDEDVLVSYQLVDSSRGFSNYFGSLTVPGNSQLSRFVNELPYSFITPLQGALVLSASAPIGIIALRGYTNERGEFLVTTLPVVDSATPVIRDTTYLAHFAVGGGWRTEIALMAPTEEQTTGTVEFRDVAGKPVNVRVGTEIGSSFSYSLVQRNVVKLNVTGTTADAVGGSIRIVPANGTPSPIATAVFSYVRNNVRVSEAGVMSVRGTRFRTYVEYSGAVGAAGSIRPGLAIANTGADAATVTLDLTKLDGTSTGLTASISVPGSGQVAKFVNELFPTLPAPFQGILRVSTTGSIALIGLRGRYNERNDFLITTVPAVDETTPPSSAELSFPHLADSAGYSTQFILFGSAGQASAGNLRLFTAGGQPLALEFR